MPQNRKQRRAAAVAAAAAAENETISIDSSIPLSLPPEFTNKSKSKSKSSSSTRQTKTLLEIAAERQQELNQHVDPKSDKTQFIDLDATSTQFLELSPSGKISSLDPNKLPTQSSQRTSKKEDDGDDDNDNDNDKEEEEEEDTDLPPLIDTLFTSLPLTTVHFTLSFLAAHQYIQEIAWKQLLKESLFIAFPVLTFIIHLAHGHILSFPLRSSKDKNKNKPKSSTPVKNQTTVSSVVSDALVGDFFAARTLLFYLPLAIFLGGTLVHTTNQEGYYAIMKRAPSIGTMWVWCVLEISSPLAALVALLVPLAWGVSVMGYRIY